MFESKGKIVLVTGATKGIGAGIAEAFAQNGADVVIVSRNQAECEAVSADLSQRFGVRTYAHSCDVTKLSSIETLVSDTVREFGRIDVLVNNAGVAVTKPAVELTEEDWDKVLNTNLKGVFFLSQAVGKTMIERKAGKVINVASMFGLVGDKGILPYLSSKGGVLQMTKGLALEWARYNIQVNAVAPGYVITALNGKMLNTDVIREKIFAKTPLRRYAEAKEVAGTVLYLASDEASYVTGSVYSVDGGWTAQ
ncbi:3-oxoacyl-ACP reductase FabG [Caproiciproducens sp. NJN-50]|uniref:SDR family NAD(P)-dependent oxidoreductase n=1 Tax=Acutalibacteraceae TaxID=3082771 RepID=UPI000FFE27C6|nr:MULTISPECIES: 3-oxoacyl-ACP reductase family protein [Acutalibacteraceae]QAT50081.1 3-oxoacyl-ACP reductase FabG [Caproiciproducens sp. NJN-50]